MQVTIDVLKFKEFARENTELPINALADCLAKNSDDFNFVYKHETEKVSAKEVIEYLNQKTGKRYRHTTPKTKRLITTRAKEGFTIDEFKQAIDNQCNAWTGDMRQYLRPETLFGTKMDSYVNNCTDSDGSMSESDLLRAAME